MHTAFFTGLTPIEQLDKLIVSHLVPAAIHVVLAALQTMFAPLTPRAVLLALFWARCLLVPLLSVWAVFTAWRPEGEEAWREGGGSSGGGSWERQQRRRQQRYQRQLRMEQRREAAGAGRAGAGRAGAGGGQGEEGWGDMGVVEVAGTQVSMGRQRLLDREGGVAMLCLLVCAC